MAEKSISETHLKLHASINNFIIIVYSLQTLCEEEETYFVQSEEGGGGYITLYKSFSIELDFRLYPSYLLLLT